MQTQVGQTLAQDTILFHVQRARGYCLGLLGSRRKCCCILCRRIRAQMECVQVGAALVRGHYRALTVLGLVLEGGVRRSLVTGQRVCLLVVYRYVPRLVQLH